MNEELKKLEDWLFSEMDRCQKEIDDGGAYYDLQSEHDAYERAMEKLNEIQHEKDNSEEKKQDFIVLGEFDCYMFDKMFPLVNPFDERFPIKSGSWTDGLGGVLLKGITISDIKNIIEHIKLNKLGNDLTVFNLKSLS